jgi:hypothetical protein
MAGNTCTAGLLDDIRRLKENRGAVSTFNAVAPDALALSMAGAICSGVPAVTTASLTPVYGRRF